MFWGAHEPNILDVESYYERKGAPGSLTDALIGMLRTWMTDEQLLRDKHLLLGESGREATKRQWLPRSYSVANVKKKIEWFPEGRDEHIDFLRTHVTQMPQGFVLDDLDPFFRVLYFTAWPDDSATY
jgi:hypothetical protein